MNERKNKLMVNLGASSGGGSGGGSSGTNLYRHSITINSGTGTETAIRSSSETLSLTSSSAGAVMITFIITTKTQTPYTKLNEVINDVENIVNILCYYGGSSRMTFDIVEIRFNGIIVKSINNTATSMSMTYYFPSATANVTDTVTEL